MTMTDPISDMLTRIKNANVVYKPFTDTPYSKFKTKILDVLKEEKYIKEYEIIEEGKKKIIRIYFLYFGKRRAINEIKKISTPGRRIYVSVNKIPVVKNNHGIAVISTSKGVMSSKKAKKLKFGGEILFSIW